MKYTVKLATACIAMASALTLIIPSASAQCNDAEICNTTMLNKFFGYAETWMEPGEVLADDEEYVTNYEADGPVLCLAPGETIGEGFSEATCIASIQRGFILVADTRLAQTQKRKKRKKNPCIPFTGTAEFGFKRVNPNNGEYTDRKVGGCGMKRTVFGSFWPERCGPTSMDPDCQG